MTIRYFFILMLLAALGCGSPADESAATTPADTTAATADLRRQKSDGSLDTAATLAAIRSEYSRIESLREAGELRQDTLAYECAEIFGTFRFFYAGDELLLASRDYVVGDHFGGEENYYFHRGQPFFAFLAESSWAFDGPMTTTADGQEVTPTRDDIHELRRYYADGRVIEELYKDYTLHSQKDNPPADQLPNQDSGKGVSEDIGAERLREVARQGTFDCNHLLPQ